MGSMIQVGSSVRTHGCPAATDSSPMNLTCPHATSLKTNTGDEGGGGATYLCVGNFSFTDWMMSCSTFWSVSVTRSIQELFVITFLSSIKASRTT